MLKIEPKTGRILWQTSPGGFISYLSGKFVYTIQSFDPGEEVDPNDLTAILHKPPYMRIARVSQKDGEVLWSFLQARAPVNVQFDQNRIEIVFKKEVQVLRYLSF